MSSASNVLRPCGESAASGRGPGAPGRGPAAYFTTQQTADAPARSEHATPQVRWTGRSADHGSRRGV